MAEADSIWRGVTAQVSETPAVRRTRPRKGFHIWHWPQYASDGSIITAYTDLDNITPLVRIDSAGREEILLRHFPGRGEFPFHVAANRVLWLENDVHPRWGELDYLTIKEFDLSTRRHRTVRGGTRMYAVALSPDGSRIAALEMTPSRHSRLMVLDAQNGMEQRAYPNGANHFLTWPTWSDDGRHLTVVAIDKSRGNALIRLDAESASADTLIPWTFNAMARPVEHQGRVFFDSPRSGLDQIHAVELASKKQYQVTSRLFGAYHADVMTRGGRDMLVFRDYGGEGDEIAEMSLDQASWIASSNEAKGDAVLVEPLAAQENAIVSVDSVMAWPIAPYGGLGRIFDVHSLALFPGDDIDPWIAQVYSRNVLNTLGATAAYRFNPVQHTHGFDVGASYAGLFPIFDVGLRIGTDAATYEDSTGAALPYTWRE